MNWRGISGIYAGLGVVIGGAWLWVQYSSVWALLAIGGGLLLAAASVAHILRVRRGPRPAKPAGAPKIWQRKAAPVADGEADAIAKARMAAIASRTTGRPAVMEPSPVEPFSAPVLDPVLPVAGLELEPVPAGAESVDPAISLVVETGSLEGPADDMSESVAPDPVAVFEADRPFSTEAAAADTAVIAAFDEAGAMPDVPAAQSEEVAQTIVEIASEAPESPVVALDGLPGFPWTARFIGLWAREVRYACPDDLRGAIGHWQRWADGQSAGAPLIEEAANEFKAMLSAWRECGAGVPGLASDEAVARQLAEEAAEDADLAALLPAVFRVRRKQEA